MQKSLVYLLTLCILVPIYLPLAVISDFSFENKNTSSDKIRPPRRNVNGRMPYWNWYTFFAIRYPPIVTIPPTFPGRQVSPLTVPYFS